MGMETRVTFAAAVPAWPAVAVVLARKGCPVEMRMIDGELAFPDEAPPDGWRELRVAAAGAMVTVRRGEGEVTLVTWGNADAAQLRLRQALAEAFAEAQANLEARP
jgi:hypothetical protein